MMLDLLATPPPEPTPEQTAALFRAELAALNDTQYGLAKRLGELGDMRPFSSILRSIQRIAAGETKISGEMQVVLNLLKRARSNAKEEAAKLAWDSRSDGAIVAEAKDFSMTLRQERAGWRITVRHLASRTDHPWPKFPETLEEAKIKAVLCLEDARHLFLAEAANNVS